MQNLSIPERYTSKRFFLIVLYAVLTIINEGAELNLDLAQLQELLIVGVVGFSAQEIALPFTKANEVKPAVPVNPYAGQLAGSDMPPADG